MTYSQEDAKFKSDGTRVAWMNANVTVKPDEGRADAADRFHNRLLTTYDNGKIRVIPREDQQGNRLSLRRDIGVHYRKAENIFQD
jgi:phosphoribosylamine--glycine ligase